MTAGVAGGVTGAVDVKLVVFTRGGPFSLLKGRSGELTRFGGCGNRESENDEGVDCDALRIGFSADGVEVVRRGDRRGWFEVTEARGAGEMGNGPCPEDSGLGSLLIGLNLRTFPPELYSRVGSADCDRKSSSAAKSCCWCGGDGGSCWYVYSECVCVAVLAWQSVV